MGETLVRNQTLQPRGFLVVVATVALSLAAAGIPSALYPTYRHEYGLSSLAQTALFATYAIALFPALLAGGKLLRRVSGTTVIMVGVVLVALADFLFAQDAAVEELFTARAVQGAGIGLINAAAGVLALTTRSDQNFAKAALGTALATAIGLGIGVLGSGVWLRTGPHPTLWPYAIHAIATVGVLIAISPLVRPANPATPPKSAVATASTQTGSSTLFTLTCTAVFLAWGYGGLLLAVLPDLTTHISPTVTTGPVLLAVMFLSVAASEWFISRSLTPSRGLVIGLVVLGIGGAALMLAATLASIPVLATAGVLLGVGLGATFVSAIASANDLIPAHRRNVLLPRFYACVFAGNAIPALITGYLAGHISLTASTAVVSATLAAASILLAPITKQQQEHT